MSDVQIRRGWDGLGSLYDDWRRIRSSRPGEIQVPDATSSPFWSIALSRSLLKDRNTIAFAASCGGEVCGILPLYEQVERNLFGRRRIFSSLTEAYGGRGGIEVLGGDTRVITSLVNAMLDDLPADMIILNLVEDSLSYHSIIEIARRRSLQFKTVEAVRSPYIHLSSDWDEVFGNLPKKMRWTLRKSVRDLESSGTLAYMTFSDPVDVKDFMDLIIEVEKKSWKEAAGTSITSKQTQQAFYGELLPRAALEGAMSGHALSLNGRPIAYILGLHDGDGVFLDLKESFDNSFAEFSPGNVLKMFAMPNLISSGVRIYDFMGACEPYKMRWTNTTYTRVSVAIYKRTIAGRISFARTFLRDWVKLSHAEH